MQSQFQVTSYIPPAANKPADVNSSDLADILRQILVVQQEQLGQLRQNAAAMDGAAKLRHLMNRWREDFPDLGEGCRTALPVLEKAYGSLVAGLVDELREQGPDALDSEFALQDFLDRYGMRLGQLGNILNLVGPLAEISSQNEAS